MRSYAVIGAGFGDEGKGKVVSSLCGRLPNPLVVRYCGGHQAGHNVISLDARNPMMRDIQVQHVFSNFGSGTLEGAPTYWSKYCTVDPTGLLNEYDVLREKGIKPVLYIDERCPITTPYEKERNQNSEKTLGHGTVGVGVGQTYQREEDHYSLTAYDLLYPWVFETKLKLLEKYYTFMGWLPKAISEQFLVDCRELMRLGSVSVVSKMPDNHHNIVFEGAQGLLLDQNFGFFPHVSRGNTGMKNIMEMGFNPIVYLVTRAYQTRHGNGPMSNEGIIGFKVNNPYEKNTNTGFQGKFRISPLDLSLLKYAIGKDPHIPTDKTLVVTCLDCLEDYILTDGGSPMIYKNEQSFLDKIKKYLGIDKMITSHNPFTEHFSV